MVPVDSSNMPFRLGRPFRAAALVCVALLLFVFAFGARCPSQDDGQAPATSFEALSARANAARDQDRIEEAKSLYKKALTLHPQWVEGWWSLGTIAYDQNEFREAADAFEKASALAPRNGNARVMLGLSEFELGKDEAALEHLKQAEQLGLSKDDNLIHVALYHEAVLLQRAGKFQSARERLEQLCLQGVGSSELERTLGLVLLRRPGRGDFETEADPQVVARVGNAGCLAGQKKYDESKAVLSAVVREHPGYRNLHYALGIILLEANDVAGAEAAFQEEIKLDPSDVVSRLEIAAATYKTNSAEGLIYAKQAVELAPHQPFAHYLLGLLLLDTDDYQKAIPELEIARQGFPREAKIYWALGTAYSRAGRQEDAARARATFSQLTREAADSRNQTGRDEEAGGKIQMDDVGSLP
jgi:tetratricopeptide (TPR) repeat protein